VKSSIDAGLHRIHVSVPTSTHHLSKKLGKEQSWVFSQMDSVISYAKDNGLEISLGAEDASRTGPEFLKKVFHHAETLGVSRVRYADTLGILTPYDTLQIIHDLTEELSVPLDFHAHNDFGMATANAMCAWKGGAQVISCSLLGLGERAGNTTLEEFVGCMHFLNKRYTDFDFLALRNLCEIIASIVNRPIPAQKPLFGKEIFRHESGIHVDGLLKNGITYEYFAPEKVGGKRDFVLGKHSGRSAVKFIAQQRHRTLSDMQAQQFLSDLRDRMSHQKGVVADELLNSYLDTLNFELQNEHW
jgi:homocitrate synthase NifV